MLNKLLKNGFGKKEDLNCAETILAGANEAYELDICKDDIKLASGFGGGMCHEGICGVVTASIMVIGKVYVKECAHKQEDLKDIINDFLNKFINKYGNTNCKILKQKYRKGDSCRDLIEDASCILDEMMHNNK